MNSAPGLAPAAKALPDGLQAFSHVQALWRFLANDRVTAAALAAPLLASARQAVAAEQSPWVLCVHDWSHLNYKGHHSKHDRQQMTHQHDVGYELQSSLLLSSRSGSPLGVPAQKNDNSRGVCAPAGPRHCRTAHTSQGFPTITSSCPTRPASAATPTGA